MSNKKQYARKRITFNDVYKILKVFSSIKKALRNSRAKTIKINKGCYSKSM